LTKKTKKRVRKDFGLDMKVASNNSKYNERKSQGKGNDPMSARKKGLVKGKK